MGPSVRARFLSAFFVLESRRSFSACPVKLMPLARAVPQNPPGVVRTPNPFAFIPFRTLAQQWSAPTPSPSTTCALFPIQRGVVPLPRTPNPKPPIAPTLCFQRVPQCPISKPFILKSLQLYPGVCTSWTGGTSSLTLTLRPILERDLAIHPCSLYCRGRIPPQTGEKE